MKCLSDLRFDNTYVHLPPGFHSAVKPAPLARPNLVGVSPRAAALLDLLPESLHSDEAVRRSPRYGGLCARTARVGRAPGGQLLIQKPPDAVGSMPKCALIVRPRTSHSHFMSIPFSRLPGRYERHYRRRIANPLFPGEVVERDDATLLEMQRRDHEELIAFLDELRGTVQRAVDLRPNEGSEVVLALKEDLDRLYETSAGLADEQTDNQAAIRQLLEVIMRNVERGAAGDPRALDELRQERAARTAHFGLLASPLVADILHPNSTIAAAELAPTLLSEDEPAVAAALQLFDLAQLAQLLADARQCLATCPAPPAGARGRLEQIAAQLARLRQSTAVN